MGLEADVRGPATSAAGAGAARTGVERGVGGL
jgi:hypothetical protein